MKTQPEPPAEKEDAGLLSTLGKWALTAVLLAVLLFLPAVFISDHVFNSHDVVLTVETNAATRKCQNQREQRYMTALWTSDEATPQGYGPCGAVLTDKGAFFLPITNHLFHLLDAPRSQLHDRLQAGCRFEVAVIGYGGPPGPEDVGGLPRQRVSRIRNSLGCDGR